MPKPRRLDLLHVFHFKAWDANLQKMVASKRPATYDAIKRRNGVPIAETRQTVPRLLLDPEGFLTE
jgi:hypothetical protein